MIGGTKTAENKILNTPPNKPHINDSVSISNIFNYFDSFDYIKYNKTEKEEFTLRALNEFKDDFIKENKDIDPCEIEVENSKYPNINQH